jgi:Beta propeller domain
VLVAAPAAAHAKRPRHRLRAFSSCAGLVGYAQRHLAKTQGQPGRTVATLVDPTVASLAPQNGAVAPSAPAPSADKGAGSATDFSTTNNQEQGVDEPDSAKTDGDTLFTVAGDSVYAISVRGESKLLGSLKLGDYGAQLLLRGHRLVAIEQSGYLYPGPIPIETVGGGIAALAPQPYPGVAKTTLTEIDVSDPAAMKVSRTLTFDGTFAAARQNGGTIRVVLNSSPRAYDESATAAKARGWLPRSHFASNVTGKRRTRSFVPCDRVSRPAVFSGLGMLSIVTLNLDRGLWQEDSDGVMTDAQTVYGSTKHLYVATQRWIDPDTPGTDLPSGATTQISRFDVTDPDSTSYEGSGSVPGYLLNQYSLSEQGGDLRVASTTEPVWWNGTQQEPSRSLVTVLRRGAGGVLAKVGQVDGLGHGERIYSVRFAGDLGYVVTFRQVDPLYVVDLSDPERPRVRGELSLLGYSAYLHPVGPGRLLGVGQDATPEGRLKGSQVSLFDVSDPAAPKLLDHAPLGGQSSTDVQYDPHAFLYWAPRRLAFLPLQVYGNGGSVFAGAVALKVTDALAEAGRIQHDAVGGYVPAVHRELVVGGRVYTISDAGVMGSDIGTFGRLSFVAFAQQPTGGTVEPTPSSPPPAASAAR